MTHQVVGYIRVSSQSQNTARQLADIKLDKEFVEIMSGKDAKEREKLLDAISYVREGDTFIVHSIDRLARNLRDLQEILTELIDKGVTVKFVKENLIFTGNDDPISKLTLHMMGAFAEFERTMIKARQREGIDAAKKSGKHLGRPPKVTKNIVEEAKKLIEQGTSIRQVAIKMKLSRATVYKALAL